MKLTKTIKKFGDVTGLDSNASVRDMDYQPLDGVVVCHFDIDSTSRLSEFERIFDQVNENLLEPAFVSE